MTDMKKTMFWTMALAATLLLISVPALAQTRMFKGPEQRVDMADRLAELGITDEQADQLLQIHRDMRQAIAPLHADIEVASIDLEKLIDADKPDRKAIEAKVKQISDLRARVEMIRIDAMLKARDIVGKDVIEKLMMFGPGPCGMERIGPGPFFGPHNGPGVGGVPHH